MKILITGGLGWTAQAIITELSAHDLILFDLPDTEGNAQGAAVVHGSVGG
jgi:nucleoside-diphosphate-sugar epimerase